MRLVDRFGRFHNYLRISVEERCNFRCTYCMPESGAPLSAPSKLMTTEDIVWASSIFCKNGVDKIRLTGGEPTIRKDLLSLVSSLSSHPTHPKIHLTTNGLTLTRLARPLSDAGLHGVNVSVDTLDPEVFARTVRRPATYLRKVLAGVFHAANVLPLVKVNAVVEPSTLPTAVALARAFVLQDHSAFTHPLLSSLELPSPSSRPIHSLRFIELMPFVGNSYPTTTSFSTATPPVFSSPSMRDSSNDSFSSPALPLLTSPPGGESPLMTALSEALGGLVATPRAASAVAEEFHVEGHSTRVGVIASMSKPFCADCNRLRLLADGSLRACLFSTKESEVRLLDYIRQRDEDAFLKGVQECLDGKHEALGGFEDPQQIADAQAGRPMVSIGG